ncbi:hypothetical protein M422DRAFT_270844 [Sphaerobolus stellatus SS14]|uniref:Uncharacterized protein n=1 Tax=Sphaerobolus stellatus (strain SS14) TaxID=990650 RepID=A0A0C9UG32_SPHS4|nr:hypothetical protein M422DRAFT_270844 [Sphaerobolus stellatus SS14]
MKTHFFSHVKRFVSRSRDTSSPLLQCDSCSTNVAEGTTLEESRGERGSGPSKKPRKGWRRERVNDIARIVDWSHGSSDYGPIQGPAMAQIWHAGTQTLTPKSFSLVSQPSNEWAILEIHHTSTVINLSILPLLTQRRLGRYLRFFEGIFSWRKQFGTSIRPIEPMIQIAIREGTGGNRIGVISGVKSTYRLPGDELGMRRQDYPIVWQSADGQPCVPAKVGSMIYPDRSGKHKNEDPTLVEKPCGMVLGSTIHGHMSFIQDLDIVARNISRVGLGKLGFMKIPSIST